MRFHFTREPLTLLILEYVFLRMFRQRATLTTKFTYEAEFIWQARLRIKLYSIYPASQELGTLTMSLPTRPSLGDSSFGWRELIEEHFSQFLLLNVNVTLLRPTSLPVRSKPLYGWILNASLWSRYCFLSHLVGGLHQWMLRPGLAQILEHVIVDFARALLFPQHV